MTSLLCKQHQWMRYNVRHLNSSPTIDNSIPSSLLFPSLLFHSLKFPIFIACSSLSAATSSNKMPLLLVIFWP
uniref:Interleukin-1 receptor-associated kinase n=1 Tax=Rhizophora mucronata TaxID=61149 RepID=A0A2P2MFD3_RHIMU